MHQIFLVVSNPKEDFTREAKDFFSSKKNVTFIKANKDLQKLSGLFVEKKPSVLIMGPDWDSDEALTFIKGFGFRHPHVSVIIVVDKLNKSLLQDAIRAGVKDILPLPIEPSSLLSSFDTAAGFSLNVLDILGENKKTKPKKRGKIISLFSTKGGVGKTVIATNLATYLSLQNKKTFIIDLDLQFGDVAVMLGIEPKRTIYETVQAGDHLDEEMLENLVSVHKESNLKALLAPVKPKTAQAINSNQISKLITLLQEIGDFIIIDTPASMDERILDIVDFSDRVLLVATMDLPSVKNAKIAYGSLKIMNVPKEKINLILNRADSKVGLNPSDVEKAIGCKIFSSIPSDRLIPRSVNMGIPCVINSPRSEVGKSLAGLGKAILESKNKIYV